MKKSTDGKIFAEWQNCRLRLQRALVVCPGNLSMEGRADVAAQIPGLVRLPNLIMLVNLTNQLIAVGSLRSDATDQFRSEYSNRNARIISWTWTQACPSGHSQNLQTDAKHDSSR